MVDRRQPSLPPGPRMPSLVQTAWLYADPVGFLEQCRRRLGPVFRVDYPGSPPFAFVADPATARQLYAMGDGVARAGDARAPFLAPLVGRASLLCLEDEEWRRQRRLIAAPLHGEQVTAWRETIDEIARREIARWPTDGTPITLHAPLQRITLEVILRVVFGVDDSPRLERLEGLLVRLLDAGSLLLLAPQLIDGLDRWPLRRIAANPVPRFLRLRDEVDALLYEQIAQRRADPRERSDLLSLLITARDEQGAGLTDRELRDELMTLLVAGHETTATALAWCFERLARHPDALARLVADLRADGTSQLDAVVKETLRCRPVVVDTPRLLREDVVLDGRRIPAGWLVTAAIALVHRDPTHFPEPDRFDPGRFVDRGSAAWIPFGGGKRRCVGSRLALLEMQTVVAAVVEQLDLRPAARGDERQRVRTVTLTPSRGARVRLTRRALHARGA